MDFLVGTSRYYDIVDYFWYEEGLPGEAYGGYKIPQLVQKGLEILRITGYGRRHDSILYIGGGMPDVTAKIRSGRYQEVIHQGDPATLAHNVMSNISEGAHLIQNAGATPVFATVCPMDISLWNQHRLSKRKTSHLNYISEYPAMQSLHQKTIEILNDNIIKFNQDNGMQTPKGAKVVYQKKGAGLPYRLRSSRMQPDGCHLTPETTGEWIKLLKDTMNTNRIKLQDKPSYGLAYSSPCDRLSDDKVIPSTAETGSGYNTSESEDSNASIYMREVVDKEREAKLAAEHFRKHPYLFINY